MTITRFVSCVKNIVYGVRSFVRCSKNSSTSKSQAMAELNHDEWAEWRPSDILQIRPNTKLVDHENTRGDVKMLNTLEANTGPQYTKLFPVNLSMDRLKNVMTKRYFVAPLPSGDRAMLELHPLGVRVVLENSLRDGSQLHNQLTFNEHSRDLLRSLTGTILDGIFTRPLFRGLPDITEKLTFVTIDVCIKHNGEELTAAMSIVDRLDFMKKNILLPLRNAIKGKMLDIQLEAFDLHYVNYLKFSNSKQYLTDDFEASFKYPLHGLLFVPENQEYVLDDTERDVFIWKEDSFYFRLKIVKGTDGQDEGQLHLLNEKWKEVRFSKIDLTTIDLDAVSQMDSKIIECNYYVDNDKWQFKSVRYAIDEPSDITTVEDFLKSIKTSVDRSKLSSAMNLAKTKYFPWRGDEVLRTRIKRRIKQLNWSHNSE